MVFVVVRIAVFMYTSQFFSVGGGWLLLASLTFLAAALFLRQLYVACKIVFW
jgi:hypothetical protein